MTPDKKDGLTLSVMSDIHVTWFDEYHYEGYENLERALAFHTEKLPPADAFLFTGDTVYQVESSAKSVCERLYTEIYTRTNHLFAQYIPDTPRFFVMGNHEYPQCNDEPAITKEAQRLFTEYFGQELRFHSKINGYHIIGASILSWKIPQSDENEAFIMKAAEEAIAENPYNPVFVMLHNPIPGTTTYSGKYTVGQYSDRFIDWLHTKPQVIVLSGHCHNINEDDSCIYQCGYTQVNIPIVAVGYMRFDGNNTENFRNDYGNVFGKSQSVRITVRRHKVTIVSYNNFTGKEVNRWEIDTEGLVKGTAPYLYTDKAHNAWPAPDFASSASVTVTPADDGAAHLRITQDFLPYLHCIKYYTVTFQNRADGKTYTVTYPTDYFLEKQSEVIDKPVPDLAPGTYDVCVYACNAFAKRSDVPLKTVYTRM